MSHLCNSLLTPLLYNIWCKQYHLYIPMSEPPQITIWRSGCIRPVNSDHHWTNALSITATSWRVTRPATVMMTMLSQATVEVNQACCNHGISFVSTVKSHGINGSVHTPCLQMTSKCHNASAPTNSKVSILCFLSMFWPYWLADGRVSDLQNSRSSHSQTLSFGDAAQPEKRRVVTHKHKPRMNVFRVDSRCDSFLVFCNVNLQLLR